MKLIGIVLSFVCIGILNASETQADYFGKQRNDWLQKAESLKPELTHKTVRPKFVVEPQKDSSAFQGIKFVKSGRKIEDLYKTDFRKIKTITLDFGDHYTGYFTFKTKLFNTPADAPVRIKFFFGELPAELNTPLDPWKGARERNVFLLALHAEIVDLRGNAAVRNEGARVFSLVDAVAVSARCVGPVREKRGRRENCGKCYFSYHILSLVCLLV